MRRVMSFVVPPVVVLLLFMAFAYALQGTLKVFCMAFFLAYLVFPIIRRLEEGKVPRKIAVLAVMTFLLLGGALLLFFVGPRLAREGALFLQSLPQTIGGLLDVVTEGGVFLGLDLHLERESILRSLREWVQENQRLALQTLTQTVQTTFGHLFSLFLSLLELSLFPLFFYYITDHYEKAITELKSWIPPCYQEKIGRFYDKVREIFSGYIRGQVGVCLLLAFLYAAAFSLLGLRFALVLGVVAGFLTLIPYLGIGMSIVAVFSVALFERESLSVLLVLSGVFLFIQLLESFFLTPRIVGNRVGIGPLASILALVVAGHVAGFWGMLFAYPAAGVVKVFLHEVKSFYQRSQFYLGMK